MRRRQLAEMGKRAQVILRKSSLALTLTFPRRAHDEKTLAFWDDSTHSHAAIVVFAEVG